MLIVPSGTRPPGHADSPPTVPPVGPLLPCPLPVRYRIEAYRPARGTAHGSLDWTVYTCETHADAHIGRVQLGVTVRPGQYGAAHRGDTTRLFPPCGESYSHMDGADDPWNDLDARRTRRAAAGLAVVPRQQAARPPAPWLHGDIRGTVAFLQRMEQQDGQRLAYFVALEMIRSVQDDDELSTGAKNGLTVAVLDAVKQYRAAS